MNTRNRILSVALVAAFAAAAGFAAADAPNPEARKAKLLERMRAADTNADNMISREEAKALPMIARHFDAIDTNKDGQVTLAEIEAFHKTMAAKHARGRLDTNGDGVISREEAAKAPRLAKNFDAIDTNKDGVLSKDELKAAHRKVRQAWFANVDTNGDGKISKAEAESRAPRLAKHFDAIDTNKDGYLTPEELVAARKAHAGPRL